MPPPVRIVLADDHPGFRAGVRARLDREPGLVVVGEAGTVAEAIARARELAPDVVVLDMELPDGSGADVLEALGDGGPEILVLSAFEDPAYVFAVLDRGAAGYLTKHEPLAAVVEAVRGVAAGEMGWLSRKISALLIGRHPTPARPDAAEEAGLSAREREVLLLVAEGLPNAAIGDRLFIAESTVKKHVHAVYDRIGSRSRAAAVAWAWRHGLVGGDGPSG